MWSSASSREAAGKSQRSNSLRLRVAMALWRSSLPLTSQGSTPTKWPQRDHPPRARDQALAQDARAGTMVEHDARERFAEHPGDPVEIARLLVSPRKAVRQSVARHPRVLPHRPRSDETIRAFAVRAVV